MRPGESEDCMRVYGGFTRALLTLSSATGPLAPVKGTDAMIEAGLTVYRNNVRAAYLRVLQDAFPVVLRLVGEEFFRYAAHEYFHAYPPRSPLVARYGDAFPTFLDGFEPAAAYPYLGDAARLEIAWLEAYHAAESGFCSAEEISDRIGGAPELARFQFHPSMRMLSFAHPAFSIWLHNREKRDSALRLPAGGERVLIVRPEAKVAVVPLNVATFIVIQSLAAGARLGIALEAALEERPDASVGEIIQTIATSGIVVSASIDQGD